jgi:hypothetical protein
MASEGFTLDAMIACDACGQQYPVQNPGLFRDGGWYCTNSGECRERCDAADEAAQAEWDKVEAERQAAEAAQS